MSYSKKDYESADGMLTKIWGPMAWTLLHTISFNYPVKPTREDKRAYKQYFLSFGDVLPCRFCRDNFAVNIQRAGFSDKVFASRDSLSRFVYKLHNTVNQMLGKDVKITYAEVRDRYEMFRARCGTTPTTHTHLERSCSDPLVGERSKCVIQIVPQSHKIDGFQVHQAVAPRRRSRSRRRRS